MAQKPVDASDLKRRALAKLYKNAGSKSKDKIDRDALKYVETTDAIEAISKLTTWAREAGIEVVYDSCVEEGEYVPEESKVYISDKKPVELQSYILMHELGHAIVMKQPEEVRKDRYGNGYVRVDEGGCTRSKLHKVDIFLEEADAWHEGKSLARKLNISLNDRRFNLLRSKYLRSYLDWIAE